ncbi:hypothetical protein ONE63_004492 [Megalurothrips usitatus]|uniref:Uncharacterized protein n=1 Tax=Megalurothrips usitatus TaxID=439358 RepID=A0AAV7X6Z9_9NEOP|nr:hypothetical protein ONE63_004492 [Megalurothrips usitatus]
MQAAVLVLAVAAVAIPARVRCLSLDRDVFADALAVRKAGAALPAVLKQNWEDFGNYLHKSYADAVKRVNTSYTGPSEKKAVADALDLLAKGVASRFSAYENFKKSQEKEVAALVSKYTTLINERLKPSAKDKGDEAAILALRASSQSLFVKWENEHYRDTILRTTRQLYRNVFHAIAFRVASNASAHKAVLEAAGQMLLHLVNDQYKGTNVLGRQCGLVEKFATDAENVLYRIAVPAQAAAL